MIIRAYTRDFTVHFCQSYHVFPTFRVRIFCVFYQRYGVGRLLRHRKARQTEARLRLPAKYRLLVTSCRWHRHHAEFPVGGDVQVPLSDFLGRRRLATR